MKNLLFALLGMVSLNSFAVDPTQGPLQHNSALCNYGYNPDCNQGVSQPKKIIRHKTIHIPSKYGALAINKKTGISGGAINADSISQAKKLAIQNCENGGKNAPCKVAIWVRNGCIAVAQGKSGSKWKTFYAAKERGLAEQSALNQCTASGASNCEITTPEGCSIP